MSNNTEQNKNENNQFLDHVNSTQRKIGHNKLQMEIETLHKEIDSWKLADSQKEIKLQLFNTTIANLQTQLREKSRLLTQLQTSLDSQGFGNNNPDSVQAHSLTQLLSDKEKQLQQTQLTVDDLQSKITVLTQELSDSQTQLQKAKDTTDLQSTELSTLKQTLEKHIRTINELESENLTLKQELVMKGNVVDNSQSELSILRQELATYKLRMEEQNQQMIETESELEKQLAFSQPPTTTDDITPRIIGVTKKKSRGDTKKRR